MTVLNGIDSVVTAESTIHERIRSGATSIINVGRLLLHCADRPGLVAAVSAFLTDASANIISLDQHSTAQSGGTFNQRAATVSARRTARSLGPRRRVGWPTTMSATSGDRQNDQVVADLAHRALKTA